MPITRTNLFIIVAILATIVTVLSLDPVPQDIRYHQFADTRAWFGLANFSNVMSNLPFLLAGLYGLWHYYRHSLRVIEDIRYVYLVFCVGVLLVALGSSYYHLAPDNSTLIWDRLPMTIAFMSFFVILLSEFVSVQLAKRLFLPLVILGVASVLYWYAGEQTGNGDLRLYALVQFVPIVFIPVILLLYRHSERPASGYWYLFSAYLIAKVFEYFDKDILQLLSFISGHSLKYLAAATGIWLFLRMFTTGAVPLSR